MMAYLSMFRIRFLNNLQYKVAAWAGIATQFAWGSMYILLYTSIYRHSSMDKPMEIAQLTSYIWLGQAFLALVAIWFQDAGISELIINGNVAYELVRPVNLYPVWYVRLLSQRVTAAALRFLPIILVSGFFVPEPYGLSAPASLTAFALFIVTLTMGLFMVVAYSMLMCLSVFMTMSPSGSFILFGFLAQLFAGTLIPLPLMPDIVQKVLRLLPFWLTWDFPFRVYSGHIPTGEALSGLILQVVWMVVFVVLGLLWMKKVRQKMRVQGG